MDGPLSLFAKGKVMKTMRNAPAFLGMAVWALSVSLLLAADWNFARPSIVPEPVSLTYKADVCCRLDGKSTVRITCNDTQAVHWVARKMKDELHVAPVFKPQQAVHLPSGGGYELNVTPRFFDLIADDMQGIVNAYHSLRMALIAERGVLRCSAWICPEMRIKDAPKFKFRAMHICWFQETPATMIERQLRLAAQLKFNYAVLETWGSFDSEKVPWYKWKNAVAKRDEIRRLCALARDMGLTLIPQLNIFGHASGARACNGKHVALDTDYRYAPVFEPDGWMWCLSNPYATKTILELVAEMHELFGNPPYFHIGCDEGGAPGCPKCRAQDWPETVGRHIANVSGFLKARSARCLMWHDMLLSGSDERFSKLNDYPVNGATRAGCEKLLSLIPKDVIVCDWYYGGKRNTFPTWEYFKGQGRDVVPSSWMKPVGTVSMGVNAVKSELFGFMGTSWHRAYGETLKHIYLPTAYAAWGCADAYAAYCPNFSPIWRRMGWDMKLSEEDDAGYSFDDIPARAHSRPGGMQIWEAE